MEEQKAKQKASKKQEGKPSNIIRENEPDRRAPARDEEDDEPVEQHQPAQKMNFDPNAKHSAFVEEAKKLMQEGDDDRPKDDAPAAGGGVKIVRKLGPQKKGAAGNNANQQNAYTKKVGGESLGSAPSKGQGGGSGFSENDIEFMKKAIQILCQSTNPLGKSIDFVTDDIDSMSKEYEYWRRESLACQSKLEEQQKITEEVIQPLQDQQAELEEKIKEQMAKINAIKSQIMHNDISIQNLLYSVIQTR